MPKDTSPNSSIAYTRWEPVNDRDLHEKLEFQPFEEDTETNNNEKLIFTTTRVPFTRKKVTLDLWDAALRTLFVLVVLGAGFIFGFLVRWSLHKYIVDPLGHCETPSYYRYDPGTVKNAMDEIQGSNIASFFEEFTSTDYHGILESRESSRSYAEKIAEFWKSFELEKVVIEETRRVKVLNMKDALPSTIVVKNQSGDIVQKVTLNSSNRAEVLYSASGIEEGPLLYGHFGRFIDFSELSATSNFTGSIVMLRTSPLFNAGSMVRNAQHFGAKGVIFFPDPFYYKLVGSISPDSSISLSVKFYPGDPFSPFLSGQERNALPQIPVLSISYKDAKDLLANYVSNFDGALTLAHSLGLSKDKSVESSKFSVQVEVSTFVHETNLYNVLGVLPGVYEPTRYVILASHHDTWKQGSSKMALGHAALMEIAGALGALKKMGWRPGRSIIFASWDGEAIGQLGSTEWLSKHLKELSSRAVAYINFDYTIRGNHDPIAASPIFREIIELASKSVRCEHLELKSPVNDCTLYDIWMKDQNSFSSQTSDALKFQSGYSSFQNIYGVSSIDIATKIPDSILIKTDLASRSNGVVEASKTLLEPRFNYAATVAKFVVILLMKLTMNPDVPLPPKQYASKLRENAHEYVRKHKEDLNDVMGGAQDLFRAIKEFEASADRFHSVYSNQSARLEFLGHHEYSDQIMELERAFVSQKDTTQMENMKPLQSPFRHLLFGPSPLNMEEIQLFPRLTAALDIWRIFKTHDARKSVENEAFFLANALKSASCVLDNHLVYTYDEH